MVQAIDRQRTAGVIKREIKRIDMLTGAGTGIVASCLLSPQSAIRTVMILTGIIMICVGWYQKAEHDQKMLRYIEKSE